MKLHDNTTKTIFDLFSLNGRRTLITGGAKGLGRVMSEALAEAGADVAIASRTLDDYQQAAEEIATATGRRAAAFQADVTSAADIERLKEEIESSFGSIDILINNAGINIRGAIGDLRESDW